MSASTTAPLSGVEGVISVTVGATVSQTLFYGKYTVDSKRKVDTRGPFIGNALSYPVKGARETTFDIEGTLTPVGGDTGSDAFNAALLAAYFNETEPDTLILETLGGKKFTFNKATTVYTDYSYEHDAEKGITIKAAGQGIPVVADGAALPA